MTLELDVLDYATIQKEIAYRQARSRLIDPQGPTLVPGGESCLAGALIAEAIRDLIDYRIQAGNQAE
jgi:hypothetical protein